MKNLSDRHEIDERKHRAQVLSAEADRALDSGNIEHARELMAQAASLNRKYLIRAEFVGVFDRRPVKFTSTVRKLLLPFLLEAGFSPLGARAWKEGVILTRDRNGVTHSILIGKVKYGGALALLAGRQRKGGEVSYFDFRNIDMRSGELAYHTQTELEAVCRKWQEIIETVLFPWFERG